MFTSVRVVSVALLLLLAARVCADEAEDRAAEFVKKLGGRLDYFPGTGKPVTSVSFFWYGPLLTDDGVKRLTAFKHLDSLRLHRRGMTDQGVKYLAELKELELLELGGEVTDAGLKPLAELKKLKILSLPYKVTGTGLKDLTALEHLVELKLAAGGMFNDEGLKFVGQMKNLEKLDINYTKITDAGLKHLAGLKKLRYLDLGANDITDKGMKALAELTELRQLRLDGNRGITGANFDDLAPLQKLEGLDLGSMRNLNPANLKKLAVLKNLQGIDARGSVPDGFSPLSGIRVRTRDEDEDDRDHGLGRQLRAPLPNDGTAHVVVRVRSEAEIWFDGVKTSQAGWVRRFVTPVLTSGKRYTYKIRARWKDNGKVVDQTRTVEVQANHRAFVDFFKASTPAGPK